MNALDRLANKKLIDVLVKVLAAMQEVMYPDKENVYFMQYAKNPILEKDEETIFVMIHDILLEHIIVTYHYAVSDSATAIATMNGELTKYVEHFAPREQKYQTETFIWLRKDPLTNNKTPVIISTKGKKNPTAQLTFSSDEELDAYFTEKKSKQTIAIDDKVLKYFYAHKHMNYSLLLFLFIFAMRDYLHYYQGYDGKCPVPYFLLRPALLDPPPTATVKPMGLPASAAVSAAVAAKPPGRP
jgi:hypothetical protein